MSEAKNNVASAVSGTPGTGTITLGSAVSGSQSFATAYGANATVDVFITDGTAWEVARDCTYTHSGTTLSRGTLEASSTGSAISLSSAAIVRVAAPASKAALWDAAALEQSTVTGTSGAITAEVNRMYVADMSGWTADRTLTLPATAAVGDRVGLMVQTGDDLYEWVIQANTGDTLNGITAAEWSRLFITGETVICRCTVANTTWVVEVDDRIPSSCRIYLSADTTNNSTAVVTVPLNTNDTTMDVGSLSNVGSNAIVVRRGGLYQVSAITAFSGIADTKFAYHGIALNGTMQTILALLTSGAPSSAQYIPGSRSIAFSAGDSITVQSQQNDSTSETWLGGNDSGTCQLMLVEIL